MTKLFAPLNLKPPERFYRVTFWIYDWKINGRPWN